MLEIHIVERAAMEKQGHRVTLPKLATSSASEHRSHGQTYGQAIGSEQTQPGGHDLGTRSLETMNAPGQAAAPETTPPGNTGSVPDPVQLNYGSGVVGAQDIRDNNAFISPDASGPRSSSSQPQPYSPQPHSTEAIAPPKRLRPKPRKQRRRSSKLWTTTGFLGLMLFSGLGFAAYQWLTWLPPDPNCQNPALFVSDSDQLYCAQQASQDGEIEQILDGIDLTANWGPGHPMYQKSQEALTDWSAAVIEYAKATLEQDGLDAAIALASRIPSHSSRYEDAQQLITEWQNQWDKAEQIYQQALVAIEQRDWRQASDHVTALRQISQPYWSDERAQELSLKIRDEQEAHRYFTEAMAMAESGRLEDLSSAVSMMQSIQPETMTWDDAQGMIKQWAETLMAAGLEALSTGDIDAALGYVQHVPLSAAEEGEPKNLLRFSHARQLMTFERVPWEVSPTEAFQLSEAIAMAQHIPSDSQFYSIAQESIAQWQRERDNVNQLQMAQWIAQVGNRQALELAIHQAELIGINEPRRLQAQTLIAHWNQEVNNIRYRPKLATARRMAAAETKDALQSAIAHVQAVGVDPIQWPESEQWISRWTQQLQAVEDRPILIEARELAANGDWEAAIERANEISAERSLYAIAQDHIEEWQSEFQLERNRAYLDEARGLASRIYLTQAIARASLIERGQPLYDEAQGLISEWVAQRERIRRQQFSQGRSDGTQPPVSRGSHQNSYEGYYDSRYYDYHR